MSSSSFRQTRAKQRAVRERSRIILENPLSLNAALDSVKILVLQLNLICLCCVVQMVRMNDWLLFGAERRAAARQREKSDLSSALSFYANENEGEVERRKRQENIHTN